MTEHETLVSRVLISLHERMAGNVFLGTGVTGNIRHGAGKMLRTRLAQALAGDGWHERLPFVVPACTAVELIHTASLFHDDVVDGASLRRGKPTLWRAFTPSGAVLIGDLLFCEALSVLLDTGNIRLFRLFNEKVKEVCEVETQQELQFRGKQCDVETCLKIARGKTGPLFAFAAMACAPENSDLEQALEEAGYRIGCAYQLADDLMDETGSEAQCGKTLGTDRLRRKYTLARENEQAAHGVFAELCATAADPLVRWPEYEQRFRLYMEEVFSRVLTNVSPMTENVLV